MDKGKPIFYDEMRRRWRRTRRTLEITGALFTLVLFLAAFSIGLAAINVYARDTQHLLELALLAWFWMTPIVYPYRQVADRVGSLFLLNPLTPVGQQYGDTFQAFATKWQSGQVSDLAKGLQGLDKQISDELKQASAGGAP